MNKSKPTIVELEKILDDPKNHPMQVLSDGSLKVDRRIKGSGFVKMYKKIKADSMLRVCGTPLRTFKQKITKGKENDTSSRSQKNAR